MRGKKKNNNKMIAMICLVVAVFALTLGFAANSRNLDITNIGGTVNPGERELDIIFDNDQVLNNELGVVKGDGSAADDLESGAVITNPTVPGVAPVISGFTSKFSEKGQSVEYKFYVHNKSEYTAYLESAQFTVSTGDHKSCVAVSPNTTNQSHITNACKDITLSLIVDGSTILSTNGSTFKSHSINVNEWKEVTIKIAYDGTNYPLPDGDMKVEFDGIRLLYTTIEQ